MLYQEIAPGPQLESFVHCFWILEFDGPETFVERILPDGRPEIVIHYQDTFEQHSPGTGKWETQNRALFIGPSCESLLLRPGRNSAVLGVRFRPGGASHFLKVPMAQMNGRIVEFSDLFSASAKELEERVVLGKDSRIRVEIMRKFLQDRLMDRSSDSVVSAAIRLIDRNLGQVRLRDIAHLLDVGERRLERHFHESIGLSPKHFARIVRFQNSLKILRSNTQSNLADVAFHSGYFDQSHFIREFKEFAGLSPANYLKEAHNLSDQFTAN